MADDISKIEVVARSLASTLTGVGNTDATWREYVPDAEAALLALESATTPAEVGPLLDLIGTYWDLAYAEGVQRRERDTKTGEAQRTWSAIEAGIATLAHQLAEAKERGDHLDKMATYWHEANRQAESQLAEATRRLGEVEAAARQLRSDYVRMLETARDRIRDLGGECDPVDVMERADPALRAFDAALQKEPTA